MIWAVKCLKLTLFLFLFGRRERERETLWAKCLSDMHGRIIPDRVLKEDKTEDGTSEILWEKDVFLMNLCVLHVLWTHCAPDTIIFLALGKHGMQRKRWAHYESHSRRSRRLLLRKRPRWPAGGSSPLTLIRFNVFQPQRRRTLTHTTGWFA